jgi:uncharacterized protein YdeI (YjbR/CyaY-like superfamily)
MITVEKFGIPIQFGAALAQNEAAMCIFCQLNEEQKQQIIQETSKYKGKNAMQNYVKSLSYISQ